MLMHTSASAFSGQQSRGTASALAVREWSLNIPVLNVEGKSTPCNEFHQIWVAHAYGYIVPTCNCIALPGQKTVLSSNLCSGVKMQRYFCQVARLFRKPAAPLRTRTKPILDHIPVLHVLDIHLLCQLSNCTTPWACLPSHQPVTCLNAQAVELAGIRVPAC
eukprot:1152039-Pelagomonas_calceolata.AAC.2